MKKLTQLAPGLNAYKLTVTEGLLDEIRDSYTRELHPLLTNPGNRQLLDGGRAFHQPLGAATSEYFMVSYLTHPLLWFSSNTPGTYQIYRRFFDGLGIEDEVRQLVDHAQRIVMYCGFLVIGDHSPGYSWHDDYLPGANAYSLLTPLFELDPGHGDLLYRTHGGKTGTYNYALGEAIMFGDNFSHCTEPYQSTGQLRILVTIQFGTDKMEHWNVLRRTIESQSEFLVLPCGHPLGTCACAARVTVVDSTANQS